MSLSKTVNMATQPLEDCEANKFRKLVNEAVIKSLADMSSNTIENKESVITVLKFVQHCMNVSSQVFVASRTSSKDHICFIFSKWFFSKIFHMLSVTVDDSLHLLFQPLITSLFQLINDRHIGFFHHILDDFLEMLVFVSKLASQLSYVTDVTYQAFSISDSLNASHFEGDLDLSQNMMQFNGKKEFTCFQLSSLTILKSLIDKSLFSTHQIHLCWRFLCTFLKYGDFNVKSCSIECCTSLFVSFGLSEDKTLMAYFFNIMCALLTSYKTNQCPEISSCDKSMKVFVKTIFDNHFVEKEKHFHPSLYVFQNHVLQLMNSSHQWTSEVLMYVLMQICNHIVNSESYDDENIYLDQIFKITKLLIKNFDNMCDCNEYVRCIVSSIRFLKNHSVHSCSKQIKVCERNISVGTNGLDSVDFSFILETINELTTVHYLDEKYSTSQKHLNWLFKILETCCNDDNQVLKRKESMIINDLWRKKFNDFTLKNLMTSWHQVLNLKNSFHGLYSVIIDTISHIVCCNLDSSLSEISVNELIQISCLPWPNFMSKTSQRHQKVNHNLINDFNVETEIQCILTLAYLFPENCTEWECFFFECFMKSTDLKILKAFLLVMPVIMFKTQNKFDFCNKWLPMLKEKQLSGEILPLFACILANKVTFLHQSVQKCIKCATCDDQLEEANTISDEILCEFIDFIKDNNSKDRRKSIQALSRIFQHSVNKDMILRYSCHFIRDPDDEVREEYANQLYLIFSRNSTYLENSFTFLIAELQDAYLKSCSSNKVKLQEKVIKTLRLVGEVISVDKLKYVILALLQPILLSNIPNIRAFSKIELKLLIKSHNLSFKSLFHSNKEEFSKFILKSMMESFSEGNIQPGDIALDFATIFEFSDPNMFLSTFLKYSLPILVSSVTQESSQILNWLCRYLKKRHRDLFMDNLSFIFCHLVCHCSLEQCESALKYVQEKSKLKIERLLRADFQRVLNELILHLGTHYDQVFNGLVLLASRSECSVVPKMRDKSQMAEFLQPRLLGFLTFFDTQLLSLSSDLKQKKQALKSLEVLINLMMPKYITPIRMKMISTLRIALHFEDKDFLQTCCDAWDAFLRNVEISALGPMLNQVVAMLIPLAIVLPSRVALIFKYLIIENRVMLKMYFNDIHFIPELPEFEEVGNILSSHDQFNDVDLKGHISNILKGLTHESSQVKLQALKKLRKILQNNNDELYNYAIGNDNVDPVVSELVFVLISGCRDPDHNVRAMFGECIGSLGAIDPGSLQIKSGNSREDMAKIHCSVEEDNFAFDLISELVRAFRAAEDTRTQNCSAFAIQEVLQIYKCDGNTEASNQSGRLWSRFPQDVLEIITPFLQSKYKNSSDKPQPCYTKPLFLSLKGRTFKEWIINWCIDLLPKVKHSLANKVYEACKMLMVHDNRTSLYLLPRILMYVIIEGTAQDIEDVHNEICQVLMSCADSFNSDPKSVRDHSDMRHLSAQIIFSIMDYLKKWLRRKINTFISKSGSVRHNSNNQVKKSDKQVDSIQKFLSSIPKDLLARASFFCQAYSRSLMYLEEFLYNNQNKELKSQLNFLQSISIALDEPDGVTGVAAYRLTEPDFHDQIAIHESTGRYQDALACYEHAVHIDKGSIKHHQGLLTCLMELDQPSTALTYATGIIKQQPMWSDTMREYQVEAAWKLGQWEDLSMFLSKNKDNDKSWMVSLGQILLSGKTGNGSEMINCLKLAKKDVIVPLSAASMENGAYQRGYPYILKLHMLTEIEQGMSTFFNLKNSNRNSQSELKSLFKCWSARTDIVQPSLRSVEPLLKLHRVIFSLLNEESSLAESSILKTEMGKCWIQSAKLARMNGHYQSASSYLLEASKYNMPEFYYEKAEFLWVKGEVQQAIITLQRGIDVFYPNLTCIKANSSDENKGIQASCASTKLLLTRYREEAASMDNASIIKMYKEVLDLAPKTEDAHFYIAQSYDRILSTTTSRDEKWNYLIEITKHFACSLQYGSQHVYQSLPRLLTIWLDFGAELAEIEDQGKSNDILKRMQRVLNTINLEVIEILLQKVPPYVFLTAFPQIISRICHSNRNVFDRLKQIISKLLAAYPNQAMWMMMAVSKSSFNVRVQRCKEIFIFTSKQNPQFTKFIQDCSHFTDELIKLSNAKVDSGNQTRLIMSQHFKSLIKLVTDDNFSSIMLPVQSSMTVALPSSAGPHPNHNPFVQNEIYVVGFEDKVDVLPSLQKPKKITVRGSDGKKYDFMCKPKDDLRKDCRLMEFNGLVNKYLYRDIESRKRHLHIRTYCVTPLNEECGLIEWVPNLEGLSNILIKLYKEHGTYKGRGWVVQSKCNDNCSIHEKINHFNKVLIPAFPPVLSEWYLKTFPDPSAWYLAKLANARTTAVMSLVGYILGLGDRHGENINYDSSCGEVVHVDFNCLFNKGETFDVPERVPFRLTHNMINAFGPLGIEGVFRRACEVTLRVIRNQKDTLMSVLKPFIHDPLVEWREKKKLIRSRDSANQNTGEIINRKGKADVCNIEQRLRGIVKSKIQGTPLSIEGQVDYLIKEATNEANLAQMYIGWAAYM